MTAEFEAELDAGGHAWRRLTGPLQRRVQDGLDAIDALVARGRRFADPLG